MADLPNQRIAINVLRRHGWERGVGGRHGVKMIKEGWRPVILPRNHGRPYSKGLTGAITKQAGLEKENIRWNSQSKLVQRARATGPRSKSSRGASPQHEL